MEKEKEKETMRLHWVIFLTNFVRFQSLATSAFTLNDLFGNA